MSKVVRRLSGLNAARLHFDITFPAPQHLLHRDVVIHRASSDDSHFGTVARARYRSADVMSANGYSYPTGVRLRQPVMIWQVSFKDNVFELRTA